MYTWSGGSAHHTDGDVHHILVNGIPLLSKMTSFVKSTPDLLRKSKDISYQTFTNHKASVVDC